MSSGENLIYYHNVSGKTSVRATGGARSIQDMTLVELVDLLSASLDMRVQLTYNWNGRERTIHSNMVSGSFLLDAVTGVVKDGEIN